MIAPDIRWQQRPENHARAVTKLGNRNAMREYLRRWLFPLDFQKNPGQG